MIVLFFHKCDFFFGFYISASQQQSFLPLMWTSFFLQVPFVTFSVGIVYFYLVLRLPIFFSPFPVPAFFFQPAALDFFCLLASSTIVGCPKSSEASSALTRVLSYSDTFLHLCLFSHTLKLFLRLYQLKSHKQ